MEYGASCKMLQEGAFIFFFWDTCFRFIVEDKVKDLRKSFVCSIFQFLDFMEWKKILIDQELSKSE